MYTEILVVLISICGSIYLYFRKRYNYWKDRNVPFEKPQMLFGSFLDMVLRSDNMGKYFAKLYNKFNAPYFGIFFFNEPYLIVKDPELLKYIQIKEFKKFTAKFMYNNIDIDPVYGNLMVTMPHGKWKIFRPHISKAFSTAKLKRMVDIMKKSGENLDTYAKNIADKQFHATYAVDNYTTDVILTSLYGINSNSFVETKNALKEHILKLFPRTKFEAIKTYSYFFMHFLVKIFRYEFVNSTASKVLRDIFKKLYKERENGEIRRDDLLDFFMDLKSKVREAQLPGIDETTFIGQAISFFIAGQETTSIIITSTLHELCANTDIQNRLRNEIDTVLQQFGEISYASIAQMKYLDMVVSESLRKYPVIGLFLRKCTEDFVIPETNFKIERGTKIIIPIHGLHSDESYFPNPQKFDPERFSEENKHNINQYMYQPFSLGPRNCIGRRFALINIKIALIYLIRNYKFELKPGSKPTLKVSTSHLGHQQGDLDIICHALQ